MKSNTIAILAIITRLRQACLHPGLLLKAGTKKGDPSGQLVRRMVGKWIAKQGANEGSEDALSNLDEAGDEDVYQAVCMLCQSVGFGTSDNVGDAEASAALRRTRLFPLRAQRLQGLYVELSERRERWNGQWLSKARTGLNLTDLAGHLPRM